MANLVSKGFVLNFNTNLHAGSGDANYGIIDKLVQREPATNRPIIHSSSLKGALREYFEFINPPVKKDDKVITNEFVCEVFGSHQNDNNMETGKCRFLAAYLLSLPVRSNVIPYFMATSVDVLKELKQEAESTGFALTPDLVAQIDSIIELFKVNGEEILHEGEPIIFTSKFGLNVTLEDWKAKVNDKVKITELENITGGNLAVFNSRNFTELCNQLPVIARNQLENGVSKNLWYEEVVPRFSRFFQFMLVPDEKEIDPEKPINKFLSELVNKDNTFQIGANATIGYGYCKFIKL
jgi:CRISPR-associated protein Cmr4